MSTEPTTRTSGLPLWLRDIDASLPTTGQYVVHGAIRDLQLIALNGAVVPHAMHAALWETLRRSGFAALLIHSPSGLAVWPATNDARAAAQQALGPAGLSIEEFSAQQLPGVLQAVTQSPAPVALVLDYVSQAQPVGETVGDDLHALMVTSLAAVHMGTKHTHAGARGVQLRHPVFWIVDRPSDLPSWMLTGDGIRQVPVPRPDIEARKQAAGVFATALPGFATSDADAVVARFAEGTEGLSIKAMMEIVQLARDAGISAAAIDDCVRTYRVGLTENPWQRDYVRSRVRDGEKALGAQVLGQQRAVRKTLDILVRSATGLTAAHQKRAGTGPRGVLFFTGPTGVGKTEMAKAIAHLVFGDEQALTRFDMSEFASEHAEARLLGAPPGYVGHGGGGELTNAVRRRPHSVLLFDEIEKAHPRIMDKFLQILSDGRLTDGSGDTVFFSESILVFTSNLGAGEVDVSNLPAHEQAEAFEQQMRTCVEEHFTNELGRPELLGRIGDNVVVFHPLSLEVARTLADAYLDNVAARVLQELGVRLSLAAPVREQLVTQATDDLSKGGRGVGMAIESMYVNPLARALFARSGITDATVVGLGVDRWGSPEVTLR